MADTYYVDKTTGDDGDSGLTEELAWETINKVNISSFNAGDSILFKRGEIWREQLTVPSSGSDGSPITFGAYGSGADPIISGSDVVTTWTEATETEEWGNWPSGDYEGAGDWNFRVPVAADDLSIDGTRIRITVEGHSANATVITLAYIGEKAASGDAWDMESGTITQITFNTGNPGDTLSAGETVTSDWITYDFDKTKDYIISLGIEDYYRAWTDSGNGSHYKSAAQADAGTADVSGYTTAGTVVYALESLEVEDVLPNVWKATLATAPDPVLFDESGTITWGDGEKASAAACVDKYDWYHDDVADLLYTYSTTDPDSAYTNVEACIRGAGVRSGYQGAGWIVVDGIEAKNTKLQAIYAQDVDPWTVQNCTIHHAGVQGGSASDAILILSSDDSLVKDNLIYEAGSHGVFVLDCNDVIVEGNEVYNSHHANIDMHAIDAPSDGCIVRYNKVYWTSAISDTAHGIYAEGASGNDVTNLEIYYNIVSDASSGGSNNGIQIDAYVASASIYNNVSINSSLYSFYIVGAGTINIKNNIGVNTGGADHRVLRITDKTNKTLTNNNWKHTSGVAFAINGSTYTTLAAYQSGESLDQDSIDSDPLFTNPGSDDFTLQAASPCRDAGVDVGLTEDYAGDPVPQGSAPEIGAYELPVFAYFLGLEQVFV